MVHAIIIVVNVVLIGLVNEHKYNLDYQNEQKEAARKKLGAVTTI
jgi:hypothetical protein